MSNVVSFKSQHSHNLAALCHVLKPDLDDFFEGKRAREWHWPARNLNVGTLAAAILADREHGQPRVQSAAAQERAALERKARALCRALNRTLLALRELDLAAARRDGFELDRLCRKFLSRGGMGYDRRQRAGGLAR